MVGVTPSPTMADATLLAAPFGLFRDHVSLMHGWVPTVAQILAAALLVSAIGWRNRRWRRVFLPTAAAMGLALTGVTYWSIFSNGLSANRRRGSC